MYEKDNEVGGQNIIAGKAAGRQEITGITRWLLSQVNKLDIDVQLGVEADVQMILNQKPDVVIVATPHSVYRTLSFSQPVVDIWNLYGDGVLI